MSDLTDATRKKIVEMFIPNELGYERIAIATVAILAKKMNFPPDKIDNIKMAMGEAVTNAIEHGNQLRPEAIVRVILIQRAKSLTLEVIDQGYRPIPKDIPVDRKGRRDNRGWGTKFITDLMDEVKVEAKPGRNAIKMIAYLDKK